MPPSSPPTPSVLQELLRLGVATEADGMVRLCRKAFVPDVQHEEARGLVAGSVADHLSAESARALEQLATSLWQDVLAAMVKASRQPLSTMPPIPRIPPDEAGFFPVFRAPPRPCRATTRAAVPWKGRVCA